MLEVQSILMEPFNPNPAPKPKPKPRPEPKPLTEAQKREIVEYYVDGCSSKSIYEDSESFYPDNSRDDIDDFLIKCADALRWLILTEQL